MDKQFEGSMLEKIVERLHLRPPTELVGVDIGTSSIKVCALKKTKTGFKLQKTARKHYADYILHDGNILDQGFVAKELQKLLKENNISTRAAAAALSSYTVVTKRITVPFLEEAALESSIKIEVESVIPYPLRDIYYNYYVMGADEEKETMMNLLIVAAKKEVVDSYMKVFSLAGLNLLMLDVDVFAVTNLIEQVYGLSDFSVVAADIGSSVTNIAIIKGEVIEFTREILTGGRNLTEDIARTKEIDYDEAEEKKLNGDGDVADLTRDFVINVASEINKTINFYVATKPRETVGRIYLTGGASLVPGLKEHIEQETGIDVEFLDPFRILTEETNGAAVREQDSFYMPVALYLSSRVGDLIP